MGRHGSEKKTWAWHGKDGKSSRTTGLGGGHVCGIDWFQAHGRWRRNPASQAAYPSPSLSAIQHVSLPTFCMFNSLSQRRKENKSVRSGTGQFQGVGMGWIWSFGLFLSRHVLPFLASPALLLPHHGLPTHSVPFPLAPSPFKPSYPTAPPAFPCQPSLPFPNSMPSQPYQPSQLLAFCAF